MPPDHSWEPIGLADLAGLRLLANAAERVECDALSRLAAVGDDELGELVAWAWVLDADRTHVLMVDHRRWGVWMAPGGRTGPGEDPLGAATRELFEETGATGVPITTTPALVDAIAGAGPDGRPATTFGVAFVFQADRDAALSPEAGQPARWWPLAAPPERRNQHLWEWMFEHLTRTA